MKTLSSARFNVSHLAMAFILAFSLLLTACASKLTADNLGKINNGMTTDEVKAILGNPTDVKTGDVLGILSNTTYTYHTGASDVTIIFANDKVISKSGEFK